MSLLRSVLRVPPVNAAARAAGSLLLRGEAARRFDRKLPLLKPFDVTPPGGQTIRWTPRGDICSKFIKYDGYDGYERPSTSLFYALARHAAVTFDVGAYLGYYAALAAAARRGNAAHAFEAVPVLAEHCRAMARDNPHLDVSVESAAVGDAAGTVDLFIPIDPMDSDTSTVAAHRPGRQATPVRAIRLDDYAAEKGIERADLIKIDTETTEPRVLAGGEALIARSRPIMLVEVLTAAPAEELTSWAVDRDYALAHVGPAGLRATERIEPESIPAGEWNVLFWPRELSGSTREVIEARLGRGL